MILYHGSNVEIGTIDLGRCRPYKDFGKGFYTSPILEQAWNFQEPEQPNVISYRKIHCRLA